MAHVSLGGDADYLLFKDDYSGYCYIFVLPKSPKPFVVSKTSTTNIFVTLETICRFFAQMIMENSTIRSFKIIFLEKVFDMKPLHLIHQNLMVFVNGIFAQLWKVFDLSSTPVGFL